MAKVVVVDDHQEVCDLVCAYLTAEGHDVQTTRAADEAIDMGYLFSPDVLIADWKLDSDYDGLEVAEAVQTAQPAVKTIVITGYDVCLKKSPVNVFASFRKPFCFRQLADKVREATKSSNLG